MNIPITISNGQTVSPYGKLVELPSGEECTFYADHFRYWKQQATLNIDGPVEVGVLQVKRNQLSFNQMERHDCSPELLIPLNGDFVLPVAMNTGPVPDLKNVQALHVKQGQAVLLNPGCWHWMPHPLVDDIAILIIFKNNTSAEDLIIGDLSQDCYISE